MSEIPEIPRVTPRILIVEDQYIVAVDCELHLRCAGFECVGLASTATGALDVAERERPDLVIMDIHLASRADGVQTAIVLYEQLGIRCIFASAHVDAAMRQRAERAHPLAWLDKPYTAADLVKAVREGFAHVSTSPAQSDACGVFSSSIH